MIPQPVLANHRGTYTGSAINQDGDPHVFLLETDLGSFGDPSSMLLVSAILASLPILLMVAIAIAVTHGRRVRKKKGEDPELP